MNSLQFTLLVNTPKEQKNHSSKEYGFNPWNNIDLGLFDESYSSYSRLVSYPEQQGQWSGDGTTVRCTLNLGVGVVVDVWFVYLCIYAYPKHI